MKPKRESKESNRTRILEIEKILGNPVSLVPDCLDKSMFCPLDGYRKKLSGGKDIEKFSKSKDEFLRGIAETRRAISDSELSFSAIIKTPHGTATFFKKGDTDQYVLAGIQNSSNDVFRMLAFSKDVLSGKLVLYSAGQYYMGTCRNTPPGREFIGEALRREHTEFTLDEDGVHRTGSGEIEISLFLFGMEAVRIGSSSHFNTPSRIMKHMLFQSHENIFTFRCESLGNSASRQEREIFGSYLSGGLTDSQFIDTIYRKRLSSAIDAGSFIIGSRQFQNLEQFAGEIDMPQEERVALLRVMNDRKGIYLQDGSRRKLLESIWHDRGRDFLHVLFPDMGDAEILSLKGNPVEIIDRIRETREISGIEKSFGFVPWSEASSFAAKSAVNMRMGKEVITDISTRDNDTLSVEYAFDLLSGNHANKAWKIPDDAKVKGTKILPYIEKMVKADSTEAREAFNELKKFIR